jgi:hypothetical protein
MPAIARIEGSSDCLFRMIVENPGAELSLRFGADSLTNGLCQHFEVFFCLVIVNKLALAMYGAWRCWRFITKSWLGLLGAPI